MRYEHSSDLVPFEVTVKFKVPYDTLNEDLCDLRDSLLNSFAAFDVMLYTYNAGPFSEGEGSVSICKPLKKSFFSRLFGWLKI
jgi:hypothetical protein